MPIREYTCDVCKHRLERLERGEMLYLPPFCPNCHEEMRRIPSYPAPAKWKGGKPSG